MKIPSLCLAMLLALPALANIDLVILPNRESTQLTIYNSADLTLVRDRRALTMRQGINRLQFSWANTLIDPTSLDMTPRDHAAQLEIFSLDYPPRVQNLGIWKIDSQIGGEVPMEISYFTSGIAWRAFYMGTLSTDETTMRLQGYVRVTNTSGEDYDRAQVRLIVGKVHLLDEIAALAQRQPPYGQPAPSDVGAQDRVDMDARRRAGREVRKEMAASEVLLRKEIRKEGLSEYFLYTIEGEETIPTGWSKRLPSFTVGDVPVANLYKYEEERWGALPVRFVSFANDTRHKLGETPIPGGSLMVYRDTGEAAHLSYEGRSSFQYIPVDEDVELNLGQVANVIVKPTLMEYRTARYLFDRFGNIDGFDEIRTWKVEVKNTRDLPVSLHITRNFPSPSWDIASSGDYGKYTKIDLDTVRYELELKPRSSIEFIYTHTQHNGRRAE